MDHFQLTEFALWPKPNGNTVVLVSKHKTYLELLIRAFPQLSFSRIWEDIYNKYDWGIFVNGIGATEREEIESLLKLFQKAICITDNLDQTFALDYHMKPDYYGSGRTVIGELVYQAKYQNSEEHALKLVDEFEKFMRCYPNYRKSDFLIYVPYFGLRDFSLPQFISRVLKVF